MRVDAWAAREAEAAHERLCTRPSWSRVNVFIINHSIRYWSATIFARKSWAEARNSSRFMEFLLWVLFSKNDFSNTVRVIWSIGLIKTFSGSYWCAFCVANILSILWITPSSCYFKSSSYFLSNSTASPLMSLSYSCRNSCFLSSMKLHLCLNWSEVHCGK